MSDWRPIDTAPKDGSKVDIWLVDEKGQGWREADARWVINRPVDPYARKGMRDGWFAPGCGFDGDGWADDPEWLNKVTGETCFIRATHWMPRPEAPEAA